MFKFDQLKTIHLEISNNCQASCPMCNRNINGGIPNTLINKTDWTLEEFKTILNEQVLKQLSGFFFCGNFGDPIMNNDLIDMIKYSAQINPALSIHVHTNGGARKTEWWEELARALPKNHSVVFALDGLADTHSLYRVGTQFDNIINNAKAFIAAGGIAEWSYIRFKHNEHQVETARQLSVELGFQKFSMKNTSRFLLEPKHKVVDKTGKVTHYLEPATDVTLKFIDRSVLANYKKIVETSTIDCKAKHDKEIYIDAHKNLFPCCWLANVPYAPIPTDDVEPIRLEMLRQHRELTKVLGVINTLERSIEDIVNSETYQTMWGQYWTTDKLIVCSRTCSVNTDFAKPRDQQIVE